MARVPDLTTAQHVIMDWSSYSDNPDYQTSERWKKRYEEQGIEAAWDWLSDEIDSAMEACEMIREENERMYPDAHHNVAGEFDKFDQLLNDLEDIMPDIDTIEDDADEPVFVADIYDRLLAMRGAASNVIELMPSEEEYLEDIPDGEDDEYEEEFE